MLIELNKSTSSSESLQTLSRTPGGKISGGTAIAPAQPQTAGGEFEQHIRQFLQPDSGNQVSEEQLFAALVRHEISSKSGDQALAQFESLFGQIAGSIKRPDGFFSHEEAAEGALGGLVESGLLSESQSNEIYSRSFDAAQLDGNTDTLWDSRGGENDPTVAVADLAFAAQSAASLLAKLDSSEVSGTNRELNGNVDDGGANSTVSAQSASPVDGTEGFLYKPESDSDGKLVVVLPAALTGQIASVGLFDSAGELIEAGLFRGVANGEREHFRFTKPGGEYPDGMSVKVRLKDGTETIYTIEDSASRYD